MKLKLLFSAIAVSTTMCAHASDVSISVNGGTPQTYTLQDLNVNSSGNINLRVTGNVVVQPPVPPVTVNCTSVPGVSVVNTPAMNSSYGQITVNPTSPDTIFAYRVTTHATAMGSNKIDVTRTAGQDPNKNVVVSECAGSTVPVNNNSKCAWEVQDSRQVLVYSVADINSAQYKNYCTLEQGGKNYFVNVFNKDKQGNPLCTKCAFFFSIN